MAPTFYGKALRFFEMRAAPATFCRTLRQRGADIKAGKRVGSAGDLAFSRQHRLNQFLQMSRFGSQGMRTSLRPSRCLFMNVGRIEEHRSGARMAMGETTAFPHQRVATANR